MTAPVWVRAFPLSELETGGAKLFRHGAQQIAVFRLAGDRLHAVDNRCPHEAYPLVQGLVRDSVLTCAWHNYKFDLRDGRCLLGEQGVRVFPVRVAAGIVEVDVGDRWSTQAFAPCLPRRSSSGWCVEGAAGA